MKKKSIVLISLLFLCTSSIAFEKDTRVLVKLPPMMQNHMLSNMRDHLKAINEILLSMGSEEFDKAANIAETRLGISSMVLHGASHMSKFMPKKMAKLGTAMHKAASRFALKVEEGDLEPAYKALTEVTTSCVACHSTYKIR